MEYLLLLDIYGKGFEFTIDGKPKFRTLLGALLGLTTGILFIVFTILFGTDMVFRKNPTIFYQQVRPENHSDPFTMDDNNILLMWRIENAVGSESNFTNKIYPGLIHYVFERNNVTKEMDFFNFSYVPYDRCSKLMNNRHDLSSYNLSQYYCFDWSNYNYTFGGSWDSNRVHYFTFTLSYCKDNQQYTKNNTECTDFTSLKDYLKEYIFISMLYPEYNFNPMNVDEPLSPYYRSYFYQLDLNLRKTDRLYFQNITFTDDQGWIVDQKNHTFMYAKSVLEGDFSYLSDDDMKTEGAYSTFYNMVFYYEKNYLYYSRSYMKIQGLAAISGGFVKIIQIIASIIIIPFNYLNRDMIIFNKFFEIKLDSKSRKLL
jgi:hypothetical protein